MDSKQPKSDAIGVVGPFVLTRLDFLGLRLHRQVEANVSTLSEMIWLPLMCNSLQFMQQYCSCITDHKLLFCHSLQDSGYLLFFLFCSTILWNNITHFFYIYKDTKKRLVLCLIGKGCFCCGWLCGYVETALHYSMSSCTTSKLLVSTKDWSICCT